MVHQHAKQAAELAIGQAEAADPVQGVVCGAVGKGRRTSLWRVPAVAMVCRSLSWWAARSSGGRKGSSSTVLPTEGAGGAEGFLVGLIAAQVAGIRPLVEDRVGQCVEEHLDEQQLVGQGGGFFGELAGAFGDLFFELGAAALQGAGGGGSGGPASARGNRPGRRSPASR